MGGLALKHLNVQRIAAPQYNVLSVKIQALFLELLGQRPDIVPAYASKPDYGDCDLIISADLLPADWRETLSAAVQSRGMVRNSDITSIEIDCVQFDFISVPLSARPFAYAYFAYNDLGNLMGRVAHKMGFKYGHLGLQKVLREGDQVYAVVETTLELSEAFEFLGYDYQRWLGGFATLEDVFKFAASSAYFNADIYLLHNLNATSRVRDEKRKTYQQFLLWCGANAGELGQYPWPINPDSKAQEKVLHFDRATARWPEFAQRVAAQAESHRQHLDFKTRWNGDNVSLWTGLSGKPLGSLMALVKQHPDFERHAQDEGDLACLVKGVHAQLVAEPEPLPPKD